MVAVIVTDRGAMVQIPPRLANQSSEWNWQIIKDRIRWLACNHGLPEMPEKAFNVQICHDYGNVYASCEFVHESDARTIFGKYTKDRWSLGLANGTG